MLQRNYHTHTYRCQHATGDVIDYANAAIDAGLTTLGMSDHAAMPDNRWNNVRMSMPELDDYEGEEDRYCIRILTPLILNDNYVALRESIINTLKSIDMTWKELQEYRKYKKPAYQIDIMIDREGDCESIVINIRGRESCIIEHCILDWKHAQRSAAAAGGCLCVSDSRSWCCAAAVD